MTAEHTPDAPLRWMRIEGDMWWAQLTLDEHPELQRVYFDHGYVQRVVDGEPILKPRPPHPEAASDG